MQYIIAARHLCWAVEKGQTTLVTPFADSKNFSVEKFTAGPDIPVVHEDRAQMLCAVARAGNGSCVTCDKES